MKLIKKGTIAIVSFFSIFICLFILDDPLTASAKRTYYESIKVPITPAVHWWQIDNGDFRAKNYDDEKQVSMVGNRDITARPKQEAVNNKLNLHDYPMPTEFYNVDNPKDTKTPSELKGVEALNPEWHERANGKQYIGNTKRVVLGHYLEINVTTGAGLQESEVEVYGHNEDGETKLNVKYNVPMYIQWRGYIDEDDDKDPDPVEACSIEFLLEGDGASQKGSLIQPSPSGSISSDSGEFDVVQGIPSSEFLRVDAQSEEYLTSKTLFKKLVRQYITM